MDSLVIQLNELVRHIRNVQNECELLSERLDKQGRHILARLLIANGMLHDNSKFRGLEWEALDEDTKDKKPEQFAAADQQHISTNPHHPEYWDGIDSMPSVYLAEMVCDWKARSDEFGTDLREWVKDKATKRWGFAIQSKVYREIKEFVDLLLDKKFA